MSIRVTLTAVNMGPLATEADYDAWAAFVEEHLEDAVGVGIGLVEQSPWRLAVKPFEDVVTGATEEQAAEIRQWLSGDGWNEFCADGAARWREVQS